ncbi:MAG: M16 family metallopeptidase [Candidatus Nitrosomaritimum yanchengensis]
MTDINYDKYVTSEGLKILNFYDPDTKRFGIEFVTKASTSVNPIGKAGLAHFAEHMLLKHTENYPDEIEFAKAFEKIGANHGASTYPFKTTVHIQGGAVDFREIVDLLYQSIAKFRLTKKAVEAERKVIEKEIIRKLSNEHSLAYELLNTIMFENSTLELGNLGRKETIASINSKDIKNFVENNYLTSNSIIVVWGGVKSKRVFDTIENKFSFLKNKKWLDPKFEFKRKDSIVISRRKSDQVTFHLGFRLPNNPDQLYKTTLLRKILCSGYSSRLVNRLRVKESLIYGWGAHSSSSDDKAGIYFEFSTAKENFYDILDIISQEIILLKSDGIDGIELEHQKNRIIKPFQWNMERVGDYADWYSDQELFWPNNIENPDEYVRKINSVTEKEIISHANKYLNSQNWYISVVGDVNPKAKAKLQRLLQFE